MESGPDGVNKALAELEKRVHLRPKQQQLVKELLQTASGEQEPSHMGSVVKKVKELKPGMEETLKRLRAEEVQSKHLYQMVVQGLTDEKKAQQKIMDQVKKEKNENTDLLGKDQ